MQIDKEQVYNEATLKNLSDPKGSRQDIVYAAMGLYAERIALAFLTWVDGNGWECTLHTDENEKIWERFGEPPYKNTQELYNMFLASMQSL